MAPNLDYSEGALGSTLESGLSLLIFEKNKEKNLTVSLL
jgi:hypothetical protein